MLKYRLFSLASLVLPLLPTPVCYGLASVFGDLAYLLAPGARNVVCCNMRQALGLSADERRVRQAARQVFRNAAKNYVDLFRLPHFDLDHLNRKLAIHGLEYFQSALEQGKGIIIATAHLGNFDLVAQVLAARSHKFTVLVEPLQPEPLFRMVTGLRSSRGLSFLPMGTGGLRAILRSLQRGEIVGVACDRHLQGSGIRVEFLGKETTLPTGAVDLALRTGATVLPAFSIRQGGGRFALYIEPPLSFTISDGSALTENMKRLVVPMEKYIRGYPEQWVVFRPIWQDEAV